MVAQETMDAIEKTVEVVEETFDTVERIPKVNLNGTTKAQQYVILGVTAGVSAALGSFVTYRLVRNKLKLRYEQLAEEEIAEARRYYGRVHKTDDSVATPEAAVRSLIGDIPEGETPPSLDAVIDNLAYRAFDDTEDIRPEGVEAVLEEQAAEAAANLEQIEGQTVETVHNIFENRDGSDFNWNEEAEISMRNTDRPYVISIEEYELNEPDNEQATLTYYAGDKHAVLADERDEIVDDVDRLVGFGNLAHRFGHGSRDANVVYIRNERIDTDFEIALSNMSYAKDVMGVDEEEENFLRHSNRPLRFRDRE